MGFIADKSNQGFITHVFENVVNRSPTPEESSLLTHLLDNNTYTKSSFLELVAQTDFTDVILQNMSIDIVGIPYTLSFA